ncbi:MAG: hypothetical protein AVDCRST_MAG12-1344, partial [uncultured Rubrobacteraceae bacterium]
REPDGPRLQPDQGRAGGKRLL